MDELKDLIASVVAYLAKRDREQAAEYEYAPVRVAVPVVDERDYSSNSVTWRMY